MKKLLSLLLFTISLAFAEAQQYSGVVYDAATSRILPFVNIGILHRGVGTVAQADGTWQLRVDSLYSNDTIRISMIGYQTLTYVVHEFYKEYPGGKALLFLIPDVQQLAEITIRPRDMKEVRLGNDFNNNSMMAGFRTNDLGAEVGTLMKVKNKKTYYLKSGGFNIGKCDYDSIRFRVNFYDMQNGKPGEILSHQPIYVTVVKGQTKVILDLEKYDIRADGDFVMSLEWLEDLPDKTTKFMFDAGVFGNRIFYKLTSQDNWQTIPIGIGCWCVAEYEK